MLSVRSIEDLSSDCPPGEHNGNPPMCDAALLMRIVGLPSCTQEVSYAYHLKEANILIQICRILHYSVTKAKERYVHRAPPLP